jgi:hypothetical protein
MKKKPFLGKWGTTLMDWEMCCNLGSPLRPFSSANIFPTETTVFVVVRVSEKKLWSLKVVVNASNGYFVFFTVFVFERERERERYVLCIYYYCTPARHSIHPTTPQFNITAHCHAIFLSYHHTPPHFSFFFIFDQFGNTNNDYVILYL